MRTRLHENEVKNPSGAKQGSMLRALLKGAIAGAVGVWALDKVTWLMWDHEDPRALAREQQARPGGLDPAHAVAARAASALGAELEPKQPNAAGLAVHYALGVAPAALYAVYRDQLSRLGPGRGVLLGLTLFVMQDEILNSLLGLSAPPAAYPWQAHARGLVGHLAYGLVTDASLEMLDRAS